MKLSKKSMFFAAILTISCVCFAFADDAAVKATQSVVSQSGTKVVSNTIAYTGSVSALGLKASLPAGSALVSVEGDNAPAVQRTVKGDKGVTLEFAWTAVPASPVTFTYTVSAPGDGNISAEVLYRGAGDEVVVPVQ
jgi:hypothetical protein